MNKLGLGFTCALLALLPAACGDPDKPGTVAHDVKETAKDVGHKVGDSLESAAEAVDGFARAAAAKVADSGEAFSDEVSSHMPEVESAVDKTKAKLNAGGAEAKAAAQRLGDKLAVLKTKLAAMGHSAAAATREMKDDVVQAYNDLAAELKAGVKRAG